MASYPIFLKLAGRRVVIIGAGAVAVRKAQAVLAAGARLVVVAERMDKAMHAICHRTDAELIEGRYGKDHLVGATLAIAATDDPELNKHIYRDCQALEILCNVVDEPDLCDFYVPAVVKRGALQVAVCTDGSCPAYAGHLRKKLDEVFTEEHGRFLVELEALRQEIIEKVPDADVRKAALGELVDDESFKKFVEDGPGLWRQYAEERLRSHASKR